MSEEQDEWKKLGTYDKVKFCGFWRFYFSHFVEISANFRPVFSIFHRI